MNALARRCGVWCLLLSGAAAAQSAGGDYRIEPQRVAAGGGRSSVGEVSLRGSIAQPDASGVLAGNGFEVTGGLHRRAVAAPSAPPIFADGFEGP
jgi:hypothetical protein